MKDYRIKTDMLRSIGKQSGESVSQSERKKGRLYGGKDLRKRKVLSLAAAVDRYLLLLCDVLRTHYLMVL